MASHTVAGASSYVDDKRVTKMIFSIFNVLCHISGLSSMLRQY